MANWAIDEGAINIAQKGFLPFEGCFEHNFLLQSCLQDARRRRHTINVAWLDLQNAFGSVPTEHLLRSMDELGLTGRTVNIIRDIYNNSTTRVKVGRNLTPDIACNQGVKQGCPLSPILFDLALEQFISGIDGGNTSYQLGEERVSVIAYADDLCLLASNAEKLQSLLDRAQQYAQWAGLKFRPNKCATLAVNNRAARHFVEERRFHLGADSLPPMKWEDHYKYLGCEVGENPQAETSRVGKTYVDEARKVLTSALTDWQKLDAIHRFVKPKLDYTLRTMLPNKGWAKELDGQVRAMAKKAFRLPRRTATPYFYVNWRAGELGLPNIEDEMDISWASQAFKHLCSKDPKVIAVAVHRVKDTIAARTPTAVPTVQDTLEFLNSRPAPGESRQSYDVRSLYSVVRGSYIKLGAKLRLNEEENVVMEIGDATVTGNKRRELSPWLRERCQELHLTALLRSPDQGKCFHSVAKHTSSSNWIPNGKYLSFSECRFAHKGKLNLLPTRTVQKCMGQLRGSIHCRRCGGHPETLAHALNHCTTSMGLIRTRHGEILHRLQ